jgi:serine O-acetyltransferase
MFARLRGDIMGDMRANGFPQPGASAFLRAYFMHPGFYLLLSYRLKRHLLRGNPVSRLVGRMIDARATAKTGCFVSPQADLGRGVIIPHATSIVIGLGVKVASGVTIYQGVTLGEGALGVGAYPNVDRGAIIYAGAKVIGDVRIGRDAVIGANAVVLCSVPDNAVAVGIPARVLPPKEPQEFDANPARSEMDAQVIL